MFDNCAKLSCCLLALCMSGCGTGTLFPVSDVPCFQPTAWSPRAGGGELIRSIPGVVQGALLITRQTGPQIDADHADGDGMRTFIPHDPVYRFSPDTVVIELVDDSQWDNLDTTVRNCLFSNQNVSPFTKAEGGTSLLFNDQEIPVAGGSLVDIEGAPFSAVVAALSTDGSVFVGIPLIPGTLVEPSGQHFHQLFSRVDGSNVGEAVRLNVIGRANQCWVTDESNVVYTGTNSNREFTICIVPIVDELPQFGN